MNNKGTTNLSIGDITIDQKINWSI